MTNLFTYVLFKGFAQCGGVRGQFFLRGGVTAGSFVFAFLSPSFFALLLRLTRAMGLSVWWLVHG